MPKFYGHANEDVMKFLKEFEALVGRVPIGGNTGVTDGDVRKKLFPMCLQDLEKTWLLHLPENSLRTWEDVYKVFMGKYFPYSKTSNLRSQITHF